MIHSDAGLLLDYPPLPLPTKKDRDVTLTRPPTEQKNLQDWQCKWNLKLSSKNKRWKWPLRMRKQIENNTEQEGARGPALRWLDPASRNTEATSTQLSTQSAHL